MAVCDVALEKPISLTVTEGRAIADAMKQYDRVFLTSDESLLQWQPGPDDVRFTRISEKQDFVNCIRSRAETIIPAEIGHRTASLCQIGHIAIELGARLQWNPRTERFVAHDEANRRLARS